MQCGPKTSSFQRVVSWKAPIVKEGFRASGPERTSTQTVKPEICVTNYGAATAGAVPAASPLFVSKTRVVSACLSRGWGLEADSLKKIDTACAR